jgi:MiaB-like tRNA modifying enzyme
MKNNKIYSEVYGCSANVADYEIALGLLKKAGFELVNNKEESNLNIIFTCTVKQPSTNRMIHKIRELTKLNKPLIVAGCMPKTDYKIIEKINPKASMLGPDSIEKIVNVACATIEGKKIVFLKNLRKPKLCLPRVRKNSVIGIVPISTGCLSNCSYCSVKFARGKLFSYPVKMIVEEANQAINNGCRELYITSQDNGCYGKDINSSLPELLNKICEVEGKFFIRVGMVNPLHIKQILNELIDVYRNEKIFKFLHLPVESGSDNILELMNRGYKVKDFISIVEKFRKKFPLLTLSTDVIVGFPEETERDFNKTLELIEKTKPDIVNISKFGSRPRTEAAKMRQLDRKIINKRSIILTKLVKKTCFENNKKWLGWEGDCLVDEKGIKENTWIGRNFAYKPIVIRSKKNLLGKFISVKITNATFHTLIASF